ncbi:MAG TPA: ABC transporter permease [Ktedonobacteraceae bacterium]|nr:ABC transporter permease [Ktedonobacteraceae bacterium]
MNDIWTMIWKETKDSIFQGGWSALIRPLLLIGIMGIVLPWRLGHEWLDLDPLVMVVVLYIPFIVIISFIGDVIAGERERHTLETLLASRISDQAILLGKIIVTTAYAWGTALVGLLLGLIVANLSKGQGSWQFYTQIDLLLEALALSLLVSLLGVSGGVLISLHSATVRQAQQLLIVATIVLVGGGVLTLKALPAQTLSSLSASQFWLIVMAVLAILDAILLGISLVSFRRARLILS